MGGFLYADQPASLAAFLILNIVLGGMTAWATGNAVAKTWRPFPLIVIYMAALAAFLQFLHYALFGEDLLSIQFFLIGYVILLAVASLGFRRMRVKQMVTQYSFAFEPVGGFGWRLKPAKP